MPNHTDYPTKIGLNSNDDKNFLIAHHGVVLNWPYKDCVLEGKQTKETAKGDETFLHIVEDAEKISQLLEPKEFSNLKLHQLGAKTTPEVKNNTVTKLQITTDTATVIPDFTDKDNLVVKGNNLIALHSLRPRFAGKVKLIYIDVPFNTGDDSFCYNDNFTHSTWLTFMKNRLEVAKDLLTTDGSIFIHADWHEVHYLKVLCDEILGARILSTKLFGVTPDRAARRCNSSTANTTPFFGMPKTRIILLLTKTPCACPTLALTNPCAKV